MNAPGEPGKDYVSQAEQSLINEDWTQALAQYEQALARLPETSRTERAEVFNGRGVAFLQLERYPEAIASLRDALKYEPGMASAYYNLALCYEGGEEYQKALENYNRAIEFEPGDAEAYFRRGGVYFILEDFEKTREDATKAIELHSGEAITGPYIARGLANHKLEHYQEALSDYTQALEADPKGAANAYFYRSLVYMDLNQALPARADLQAFLLMTDEPDGILGEQAREIIEVLDKETD